MCGIAGFISNGDKRPADRRIVMQMADTLTHRGPDSAGYFVDFGDDSDADNQLRFTLEFTP